MTNIEIAEAAFKTLRPDARREVTNSAYRMIVNNEVIARREKTRRLQQARAEAGKVIAMGTR